MADMIPAAHGDQTFCDKGPVQPDQRRDIGHGAERNVMQHAQQIRLRQFAGPEASRPQFAVDRHQCNEHEADRGEMAEPRQVVEPVRIHERFRLRQFLAALVMIDNNDRHSQPTRFG